MNNKKRNLFLVLAGIALAAVVFVLIYQRAKALFSVEVSIKDNVIRTGQVALAVEPTQAMLTADNLLPGQSASGTLKLINTGTSPLAATISVSKAAGFTTLYNLLQIEIRQQGQVVYSGSLSGLTDIPLNSQQSLPAAQTAEYQVSTTLPQEATSAVDNLYTNLTFTIRATQG